MLELLHAADLHLDSPFAALRPEQAAQRRALQRQLPDRIVDLGNDLGCPLLLLAGDIFDGERVCPETIAALRQALARFRGRVFIAPGNHDPYGPRSPWAGADWPENVHIFTGAQEAVALPELGCRVWGAAFGSEACFDALEPVEPCGLTEIGVLHADPEKPGPYRYLPPAALQACGLDYLALGHIHKTALPRRAGNTWYGWPGVALGRGFDECGVHGVFHVILDGGDCRAELLPLPGPRYERITVRAGEALRLPEDSGDVICRLCFTGESEPLDLERLRETLAPRFLALELRDETTPPPALWDSCGDGTLRGLALGALRARYDRAEPAERPAIALAARYVLAALEGREAP